MATKAYHEAPLDALLATIPSLPRPILARLTTRLIDRLDELDPDPDLEDDDPDTSVEDSPEGFDPEEDMGIEDMLEDARGGDVCEDDRSIADPQAYREHRERLRRERSFPLQRVRCTPNGYQSRILYVEPTVLTKRQLLRRKRGMPKSPRA